jgi:dTDP-4-dehydrorhamnose 3,5-epimerase
VTSDHAVLAYKCSALYAPKCEQVIRWNDPSFDIPWPVLEPILAPRDAGAPLLAEIPVERLPRVAP